MDSWPRTYEVEKPKPIKVQAKEAADVLAQQREHFVQIHGSNSGWLVHAMDQAIGVLRTVAGEKPKL